MKRFFLTGIKSVSVRCLGYLSHGSIMQLPMWESKETVEKTMPVRVKYDYLFTRVILDCTEIFIEKPSCFRAH